MEKKRYIHYGHKSFDKNNFNQIENHNFVKPKGGLWASPVDTGYGWRNWCEDNDFRECDKDNSFEFVLSDKANVFHLYDSKELEKLPKYNLIPGLAISEFIDFEKMLKQGYDGIELHLSEEITDDNENGLYWKLYGWDCDSILIMNPDIVVPV